MKNKILLLTALSIASLGFSSDWTLTTEAGYKATLKREDNDNYSKKFTEAYKFDPTLPVSLKVDLHPSDVDLKTSLEMKNEKLDGLFKTNKLDESEVMFKFYYGTPELVKGFKLFTDDSITIYKKPSMELFKEEAGDMVTSLGGKYSGVVDFSLAAYYNSNKIITPKEAGLELTLGKGATVFGLKAGYDFEAATALRTRYKAENKDYTITDESKVTEFVPVHATATLKTEYTKDKFSMSPSAKLETRVLSAKGGLGSKDTVATTLLDETSRLETLKQLEKLTDTTAVDSILFATTKGELKVPLTYKLNKVDLSLEELAKVEHNYVKETTTLKNSVKFENTLTPKLVYTNRGLTVEAKDEFKFTLETPTLFDAKDGKNKYSVENELATTISYAAKVHKQVVLTPALELKYKLEKKDLSLVDLNNTFTVNPTLNVSYKPVSEIELYAKVGLSSEYAVNIAKVDSANETRYGVKKVEPSLTLGAKFNW